MKSLNDFPRIPLAVLPTPIQKLENISRILGTNVYIKRDDLTGIGLGGNKVRKLEFLLADAKRQGAVEKNIRYPMEIAGVPRARINARVKELLKIVGLEDKAKVYPVQLSGGQRQRVAIARALASDPEVLLCDEATSALDPMTTQSILKLLQDINRELGITMVVITHEMAVIRQICTHVAILDGGVIAEEGSVDEVFTHTKSAAGRRLFGIVTPENEEVRLDTATPPVRLVFDGAQIGEPVVANLILKLGLPVSILSADVRTLNGKQFGQMLIELPEDPVVRKTAMEYLRAQGVTAEEVHG